MHTKMKGETILPPQHVDCVLQLRLLQEIPTERLSDVHNQGVLGVNLYPLTHDQTKEEATILMFTVDEPPPPLPTTSVISSPATPATSLQMTAITTTMVTATLATSVFAKANRYFHNCYGAGVRPLWAFQDNNLQNCRVHLHCNSKEDVLLEV